MSKALPIAKMLPGVGPIISAVKPFCQTLPQMQPLIQQAPGIQPIYTLGTKICKVLGKVGIAGAEGAIMEAPDGQLYEVVESIGEYGAVRRSVRRVWLSIPATIRPRRMRRRVGPGVPAASTVPALSQDLLCSQELLCGGWLLCRGGVPSAACAMGGDRWPVHAVRNRDSVRPARAT